MKVAESRTKKEKEFIEDCLKNEVDEVRRLLKEEKVNVNCFDEFHQTPCYHAASKGHLQILEILKDFNADFEIECFSSSLSQLPSTPLEAAQANHHQNCVEFISKILNESKV